MFISVLFRIFLPVLAFTSVIITYVIIIAKRQQKATLMANPYAPNFNAYKVIDHTENLWWMLTITLIFLSYFGLIVIFYGNMRSLFLPDAILFGFVLWSLISYLGFRITRH